jgi:TorA maturation chaperone TorD
VYSLLANVFAYPREEQLERGRESAVDVMHLDDAGPRLSALALAFLQSDAAGLEREHVSTFTLSTSSDCPLFETAFAADSFAQSDTMADIAGFYRAFGVAPAGGTRPDELTAELEFMAFLCAKEDYAAAHLGPPRVRQARRAQRLFLRDHLLGWAPELGARVAACAPPGSVYALAGQALAGWLADERAHLGVKPRPARSGATHSDARTPVTFIPEQELAGLAGRKGGQA